MLEEFENCEVLKIIIVIKKFELVKLMFILVLFIILIG